MGLERERNESANEANRLTKQKNALEQAIANFRHDSAKSLGQVSQAEVVKSTLQAQLDSVTKENEYLRKDVGTLEELIRQKQKLLNENDSKCNDQFVQIKLLKDQIYNLKIHNDSLND